MPDENIPADKGVTKGDPSVDKSWLEEADHEESLSDESSGPKTPIRDQPQTGLGVGLSDEEKSDLENLIKTFKQENPGLAAGEGELEDVQKKVNATSEHLAELSELLLKLDKRMNSFYEIVRLSYKKSELMNKRIDEIIELIEGGKKG